MPSHLDDPNDPRSTAEKARADLRANSQLGLAPPESPIEERPSVTPETFGEGHGFKDEPETLDPGPPTPDALTRARD